MAFIKFGTYSRKIKSFSAREVGLDSTHNHLIFDIRQKVFHIWFLPLFPVEKTWKVADKTTGKEILETTPKMRSAIDLKLLKQKSPIWSYTGLLIIALPILFVLGVVIYGAISDGIDGVNKSIAKNDRISLKEELVNSPQLDDHYTFKTLTLDLVTDHNGHIVKYEANAAPYSVNYAVVYMSKDSIGFEIIEKAKGISYAYGLKKEFRLSKKEVLLAAKGYQELKVHQYENKPGARTKDVVGVFKIKRE